jgi:excinuclease ABC subunit C
LKNSIALVELKDALNLGNLPKVIEGFDISHLSGTNTVASMVQFRNGEPNKSEYRRFKIKTLNGEIDDFKAMKEVVLRRYKRLILEEKPLPDLVLIDGGRGQLSSAVRALKSLQVNIPIISIAKKFEEIWIPNRSSPIRINKKSHALRLLQRIRDESHRFAISYNKLLRRQIFKE